MTKGKPEPGRLDGISVEMVVWDNGGQLFRSDSADDRRPMYGYYDLHALVDQLAQRLHRQIEIHADEGATL